MIIKKLIIFLFILLFTVCIFVVFLWEIPAPTKRIEKNLEINRLKVNE